MKLLLFSLVASLASPGQSQPSTPRLNADRDVAAVMATINAMLAGVATHDSAAMLAVIRPEGKATVAVEKQDGSFILRHLSWTDFVAGIKPGPEKLEPRLKEPIVKVDGDIAMAWTPYTFLIDGKVHHCGINHFDLVRENGGWKILNVTYSYRTVGCDG
jgi:hypothetical protein